MKTTRNTAAPELPHVLSLICNFVCNDNAYSLLLNTKTDTTTIRTGQQELFTIDSNGYMSIIGKPEYYGKFSISSNHWVFTKATDVIIPSDYTVNRSSDLYKFEVQIAKQILFESPHLYPAYPDF